MVSFLLFSLSTSVVAQNILATPLSVEFNELPLSDALFELSDRAGIGITFTEEVLPPDRTVTLFEPNITLGAALDLTLSGTGLGFEVIGRQIVLVPIRYFVYSGYLEDQSTGERLIGAAVYDPVSQTGVVTNEYGFFSLRLPAEPVRIRHAYLGYKSKEVDLRLRADRNATVGLEPSIDLAPVEVLARAEDKPILQLPTNAHRYTDKQLEKMTGPGGESDLLQSAQLLSGIQTGADGFGGLSVRGGSVDQNLFLLDGVPVYNGQHGLGLVSIYNSDAIRSATIYKGPFPARYGGRLSSVVDVRIKEGNSKEIIGAADVGLTSAKLTLEGPLVKDRSSFFVSGRRSLIDLFTRPFTRQQRAQTPGRAGEWAYFFEDINAKINYRFSDRDQVYLSLYRGGDQLSDEDSREQFQGDTLYFIETDERTRWGNTVGAFRWNHLFNPQLFGNLSLTFSRYDYNSRSYRDNQVMIQQVNLSSRESLLTDYRSNNQDLGARVDFDYLPSPTHHLRFGASWTHHEFQPGIVSLDNSFAENLDSLSEQTIETLLGSDPLVSDEVEAYLENDFEIVPRLYAQLGIRSTCLMVNGGNYWNMQPRGNLKFTPSDRLAIFVSGGRHVQTLHLLSNTGIGLPLDLWVTSTERVPPQTSWQVAGGVQWLSNEHWTLELEAYRKTMRNLITFEEGVIGNVNATSWQNRIRFGTGEAQGLEFRAAYVLPSTAIRLNYTYARATRQFPGINDGQPFPYRFDRRHMVSLSGFHEVNDRWLLRMSFQFGTGMAFTVPAQEFLFAIPGFFYRDVLTIFSERNRLRMPANHRLDIGAVYQLKGEKIRQQLSFGIYNVYNRTNPLYFGVGTRLDEVTGEPRRVYTQTSLFPIFPYVRYKMSFGGKSNVSNE